MIKDTAILIGFDEANRCVYSARIPLGDYWDEQHPWDDAAVVLKLQLRKVRGYLFDSSGTLLQEFESNFDPEAGIFASGWTRHEDGTFQQHDA